MNVYTKGDVVRIAGGLADLDGTPGEPGALTIKYRPPGGAVVSKVAGIDAGVIHAGVGSYYLDVQVDTPGVWRYRFESTVTRRAAGEGRFTVLESGFD